MDATSDDFMVVQEEYGDFSFFAHECSLTHQLFPCPGWPVYRADVSAAHWVVTGADQGSCQQ